MPPKDRWDELLVEGESQYQNDLGTMVQVVALIDYLDIGLQKIKHPSDPPYEMNKVRAEELAKIEYIKILED